MVIKPGHSEGSPGIRHRRADQYLFVLSGVAVAKVNRERYPLQRGVILLIERGEEHEIRNTRRALLRTVNFYDPPAYSPAGDELAAAKP